MWTDQGKLSSILGCYDFGRVVASSHSGTSQIIPFFLPGPRVRARPTDSGGNSQRLWLELRRLPRLQQFQSRGSRVVESVSELRLMSVVSDVTLVFGVFFVNVEYSLQTNQQHTHSLSCTPRAAATMTAGRSLGAWRDATPQGACACVCRAAAQATTLRTRY